MAVTVKKAVLWRKELDHRPGTLARSLQPLADAGVGLQVVMGYRYPDDHSSAALEVYPIQGAKAEQAARQAGMAPAPEIACLIVSGDDSKGLGHTIAERIAAKGINISFVVCQVSGRQYHAVFGFQSQADADQASTVIKEAGKGAKKAGARKGAAKKKAGGKKTAAKKGGAKKPAAKKGTARGGAKKPAKRKAKKK